MKKIGIVGGVGPQATEVLYRKIIEFSQRKFHADDNADFPSIIIESVPIPDFISDLENIEIARKMLQDSTLSLTNAGATVLCIGSNTVHLLLEDLKEITDVGFISIPKLVGERCNKFGYKKVGLLGSPVTLNSDLYQNELNKLGIEIILPNSEQIKIVDKIIRYVLAGKENKADRQSYIDIISNLIDLGAEGIILGCTELPLAINYEALGDKILNSMDILAENLVDYYYSE